MRAITPFGRSGVPETEEKKPHLILTEPRFSQRF